MSPNLLELFQKCLKLFAKMSPKYILPFIQFDAQRYACVVYAFVVCPSGVDVVYTSS